MYIADTIPTTLAEMLAFLQPTVSNGLFDSVAYDDESPTKIVCTQNENTILEMTVSSGTWTFTPYITDSAAATGTKVYTRVIVSAYRFSGGVCFIGQSQQYFVIAKTSANKTGFILFTGTTTVNLTSSVTYYPVCFGDNITLWMSTNGYKIQGNSAAADRTILTKIPVVGRNGSNDYFTSVYVRNAVQFAETGQQEIGGQMYGCVNYLAFTDD